MEDLQGWQSTRWGMTPDEVKTSVYPQDVITTSRQEYGSSYSELKIENVSIGAFLFDIMFLMDNNTHKLRQVSLTHDAASSVECEKISQSVKKVLHERFGVGGRLGTSDDWIWLFRTTAVILSVIDLEGIIHKVAIIFRAAEDPLNRPDNAF